MKDVLYKIISEINPFEEINDDTLLIEEGILDSLSFVYLINGIEEQMNIVIPEDLISPRNFSSISAIENLLKSL